MADIDPSALSPAAGPQPSVTPADAGADEAPAAPGKTLAPELLKLPAIQAIVAGAPPAVSSPIKDFEKTAEAKLIRKHADALQDAGIGLYRALDGKTGVMFNSLYVHPQDLQAADKAGQLSKVAPPIGEVTKAILTSGANHPALRHPGVPLGPKLPSVPTPPTSGSIPAPVGATKPLPASAQTVTQNARLKNLGPGAPTSGPTPGAGRLLSSILKPVI